MVESALKQKVLDAVEQLPSNATIEDVIERLVFLAKIGQGLAQADAGQLIPHDQVAAPYSR
jgi:predicted transcriptional regulator